MALIEKLTAIADAVREKTGGDQLLTLDEIKNEIAALSTEPTKPYIDSSRLSYSRFCQDGQNLDVLADPNLDPSQTENISYLMYCARLRDVPAVQLSFLNAKYAERAFSGLGISVNEEFGMDISRLVLLLPKLVDATRMFENAMMGTAPALHLSTACKSATRMFYGCLYLQEMDLREADGVESFHEAFYNCPRLQRVQLNMRSVNDCRNMFYGCSSLTELSIGTFKIKDSYFRLDDCPLLTVESLVGVLNALESNVGENTTHTVILGSENLAKLTDEQKQIAIDKNLTLA